MTRSIRRAVRGIAAVGVPLAAVALALAAFGVASVRNDSMSPTLRDGQLVLYDRWSAPTRGDIVLFVDREAWSGKRDALLIKRIVGVAGDVIACCEAGTGRLIVNGDPVEEDFAGDTRPGGDIPFRVTVPGDAVWVMGDNRAESADSRLSAWAPGHGAIARADLRGTARGTVFPPQP